MAPSGSRRFRLRPRQIMASPLWRKQKTIRQLEIDYSAAHYEYETYRDQISGRYSG